METFKTEIHAKYKRYYIKFINKLLFFFLGIGNIEHLLLPIKFIPKHCIYKELGGVLCDNC